MRIKPKTPKCQLRGSVSQSFSHYSRLYSKMETQETGNWMESGSTKFNKLNCKWKLKWKLEWKLKWKLKEKGPPFGKKKNHVTFF